MSTVYTSGSSESDRIGRPRNNNSPSPITIPPGTIIASSALGWKNGYLIDDQNRFWSWGTGCSWRIGVPSHDTVSVPTIITPFPPQTQFKHVVAGDKFAAVLTIDGSVIVWGAGYAHSPTKLELPLQATHIAAGQIYLVCTLLDGSAIVFHRHAPARTIHLPNNEVIIRCAAGSSHILALSGSGQVYGWGSGAATGVGRDTEEPTLISAFNSPIVYIAAFNCSSWFLSSTNEVYCCGSNSDGCLGLGNSNSVNVPVRNPFNFGGSQIAQIACGDKFTLVLTQAGSVYATGSNSDNQFGISTTTNSYSEFTQITELASQVITQICAGCFSSCFVCNAPYSFDSPLSSSSAFDDIIVPTTTREVMDISHAKITINPDELSLCQVGLKLNDILQFSESVRCKVCGVLKDGRIVVLLEKRMIYSEIQRNEVLNYRLLSRAGSELQEYDYPEIRGKLVIDCTPSEVYKQFGLEIGDSIQGVRGTIAGCRGILLFSAKDGIIENVDYKNVQTVTRKSLIATRCIVDQRTQFIEVTENKDDIYLHPQLGCCWKYGTIDKFSVFCSPSKEKFIFDQPNFLLRSKVPKTVEWFSSQMEPILVDIGMESTLPLGFAALDSVEVEGKDGLVIGIVGNKVAVSLMDGKYRMSTVTLFDPKLLRVRARICSALTANALTEAGEEPLSINTDDFTGEALPGDLIHIENKEGEIVGSKSGETYAKMDGENVAKPIKSKYVILRRRTIVARDEKIGSIKFSVSSFRQTQVPILSGEKLVDESNKEWQFLGLTEDNHYVYQDYQGEVIMRNSAIQMLVKEH